MGLSGTVIATVNTTAPLRRNETQSDHAEAGSEGTLSGQLGGSPIGLDPLCSPRHSVLRSFGRGRPNEDKGR
jgi:hypothetical protein